VLKDIKIYLDCTLNKLAHRGTIIPAVKVEPKRRAENSMINSGSAEVIRNKRK
jgi:hypothetical protein